MKKHEYSEQFTAAMHRTYVAEPRTEELKAMVKAFNCAGEALEVLERLNPQRDSEPWNMVCMLNDVVGQMQEAIGGYGADGIALLVINEIRSKREWHEIIDAYREGERDLVAVEELTSTVVDVAGTEGDYEDAKRMVLEWLSREHNIIW